MEPNTSESPEAWEGHGQDDLKYGNPSFSKEDFLRSFNSHVMKEHPDFDKAVLAEFGRFFNLWELEMERMEQISAQGAHRKLIKYLKF